MNRMFRVWGLSGSSLPKLLSDRSDLVRPKRSSYSLLPGNVPVTRRDWTRVNYRCKRKVTERGNVTDSTSFSYRPQTTYCSMCPLKRARDVTDRGNRPTKKENYTKRDLCVSGKLPCSPTLRKLVLLSLVFRTNWSTREGSGTNVSKIGKKEKNGTEDRPYDLLPLHLFNTYTYRTILPKTTLPPTQSGHVCTLLHGGWTTRKCLGLVGRTLGEEVRSHVESSSGRSISDRKNR